MSALLSLRGVHVTLEATPILRGASLELEAGQHTLILGPSGAGKTTLLNVAAGLVSPSEGEVLFRGEPLNAHGTSARLRRDALGIVFQDLHLLENLTAAQNIALVQAAIGAGEDAPSPESLLSPLGLGDRLTTRVSVLSRGERQRVALARAFANRPSLVLADEPTSSLDPGSRTRTLAHLWALCEETGATALVVSHDAALEADAGFVTRSVLSEGRLSATTS